MLHREFKSDFSFDSMTDAVARMIDESNLTMKQIAARTGKTYSTLSRELNTVDDGAKLGADIVLPLMIAAMTNGGKSIPYPLYFLAENLGYRVTRANAEPSSDDSRDEMLDDNHALTSFHAAIRKGDDLERLRWLASKAHEEIDETLERVRLERKANG